MLVHLIIALAIQFTQADQEQASSSPCTFSCPMTNIHHQPLFKHDFAIPYDSSYYSVFECVYVDIVLLTSPLPLGVVSYPFDQLQ